MGLLILSSLRHKTTKLINPLGHHSGINNSKLQLLLLTLSTPKYLTNSIWGEKHIYRHTNIYIIYEETKKQSLAKSACIGYSSPGTNCLHTFEAGTLRKVGVSLQGALKQRMEWHKGAGVMLCWNQCTYETKEGAVQQLCSVVNN